ncbi:hypothetical protein SAY86_020464 [Trapa natans]|uniref:Uncharacterized protein n=1 Tax=Trapa natans TaxID=22666 RepID=A0AAN7M2E0_TRANT|nr:hypothetical protein SAY86_020464 [Trapa natans]
MKELLRRFGWEPLRQLRLCLLQAVDLLGLDSIEADDASLPIIISITIKLLLLFFFFFFLLQTCRLAGKEGVKWILLGEEWRGSYTNYKERLRSVRCPFD